MVQQAATDDASSDRAPARAPGVTLRVLPRADDAHASATKARQFEGEVDSDFVNLR
jgi:hypothetical protein